MKIIYRIEIAAACPVDDQGDRYEVTIESCRVIMAEEIMRLADEAATSKSYQETICATWARALRAKVTMVGWHGRVRCEVTCG